MSRKRKRKEPELAVASIRAMAHNGCGIADVDGRTVFVEGALPGERVEFVYTRKRRETAEGRTTTVIEASPDRVEPECVHFDRCGGCNFQHLRTDKQILAKQAILVEQLKRIGKVEAFELLPPMAGPHWGYRHRARLGVKNVFKKGRVLVGFREKASPYLAELDRCLVLHPQVGERLLDLSHLIESLSINEQIPQIEVAVGENRTALVFRVLEAPSAADLQTMQAFADQYAFDLYLQPKGPDSIQPLPGSSEYTALRYQLPESVTLSFGPSDFVQVNPAINRSMIEQALALLDLQPQDRVLDLFCGLGNFSLPMARRAGSVTAVEGSEELVLRAAENARLNDIDNASFFAADLFAPVQDARWCQQSYDKVLIDPPRTGAKEVLPLLKQWQPQRVVYVSCNPATLARDTQIITSECGYRLVSAGVMDMFPHTGHVESMALFERL